MQDKIFWIAGFGFLLGVLGRSFYFVNFYFALTAILITTGLIFLFLIFKHRPVIITAFFILLFALGILRLEAADYAPPEILEAKVETLNTFSGIIADEPSVRENNQHLVVQALETKILLIAGLDGEYKYGDEIKFGGKLQKPENFETDQGKIFDYVNYLRKDGILYTIVNPEIEIISRGHGNILKRALFAAKDQFLENINFTIPAPESTLLGGLILGERSSFSQELRQNFIDTGTIHIVALSGYNVTIVAEWIMKLLAFLPANFAFGAGIFSIFIFVLMTGGSSTAVRAGAMATLGLVARATGRNYDVARALMFAVIIMVLWNPLILAFDVSFQLSVLATIAIIFIAPRVEKYFNWVPRRFNLREIVSLTTAAYVFVFPFILYKMGNLSLVALPANFLVLPFIPATMALGFFTGALGLVWYGLAVPVGFMAYLLLYYELGIINLLADLPGASFVLPSFPLFLTLFFYALWVYWIFGGAIKNFFQHE